MSTNQIVITINEGNNFDVMKEGRTADGLCWDEMLGTIAELTHPKLGNARNRMLTSEEIAERERKHQEHLENIRSFTNGPTSNGEKSA